MDDKLIRYLEKTGVKVKKTANGFMAYCPSGMVTWHRNHSGHTTRARADNLAKDFRRAGICLPQEVIAY